MNKRSSSQYINLRNYAEPPHYKVDDYPYSNKQGLIFKYDVMKRALKDVAQNATINYNRKVEIDAYYNLDLRDADYVFNAQEVKPVIQFIYEINCCN